MDGRMDTARCAAKAGDPGDGQGEAGLRGICFPEPRQAPPSIDGGQAPLPLPTPRPPTVSLRYPQFRISRDVSRYLRIPQGIFWGRTPRCPSPETPMPTARGKPALGPRLPRPTPSPTRDQPRCGTEAWRPHPELTSEGAARAGERGWNQSRSPFLLPPLPHPSPPLPPAFR